MITAKDVYDQVVIKPDPLVDEIIQKRLIPLFRESTTIKIKCADLDPHIKRSIFVAQMRLRGFHAEVDYTGRGVAESMFRIKIPPQGE